MNFHLIYGDLLAPGGPTAIAHGCNTGGIMGAGIAKQIRERFPAAFEQYKKRCRAGQFSLGDVDHWHGRVGERIYDVFSLGTQVTTGRDARLVAIEDSMRRMVAIAERLKIDAIGMPKIGCGLGGLAWAHVAQIVHEITGETKIKILVYELPGGRA